MFSGYATIPFADIGDGEALGWAGEIGQVETRLHIVSLPEDPKMAMIRANDKLIRLEESVSESDSLSSRRSARTESSRSSTLFKQPEPVNGEYEDIVMNIKLELRRWSGKDFMKYLKQRAPESNKKLRISGSDYENTSSSSRGSLRRRDSSPAVKPNRANPNLTVLSPTKVFPEGVDYTQPRVKRGSGSSSTASTNSQPHSQDFNYDHTERKKRYAYPDNTYNNNPLATSQNMKSKRTLNYSFESNDDDDERYLSSSSTHSGQHLYNPPLRGHAAQTPRSQSSNYSDAVMNLRESYSPISMPPSPRYPPIGVSSTYLNYTPTSTPTNAPPQPFTQGSFQQRHMMMQGQLPPLQIPPSHNMNLNQGPPSLSTSTSASSSNNNQYVPYQSSFEEASIEMAIEAALSKIQEMLNDSLHKKQVAIDRLRTDASQSQRLIDSLNDQLNSLTLQSNTFRLENEQLKMALRDKDQSELASFMDPNIDQLSKEELLVKYKTLLTSLSAQQMEPRTQYFQALANQRKKSQEELEELRGTRQQLHQEVRNLEDKKNKLEDDLENRTVNDALFLKLNSLLTNAVKVANNQHAKQMRVDLNQQKLLQRLQEEEERNRELQVKLKNNSHEFTEALLSMQRKLLKRTKQFHEVKRQLKLLNHELTHVSNRD